MTYDQKMHAARILVYNSPRLMGNEMFLPRVYVVNGKLYWFLNAARRAAFGTDHPIEVMTIETAYDLVEGKSIDKIKHRIAQGIDQTGEVFHGSLFGDRQVPVGAVTNKVIFI